MSKLDLAIASVEEARKDPEPKQDVLAEAVMLTVQQVRACDEMSLEELSKTMSAVAEATGLTEDKARKIAWGKLP